MRPKLHHSIGGTSRLECPYFLEILTFKMDITAKKPVQGMGSKYRCTVNMGPDAIVGLLYLVSRGGMVY